MKSPTSNSIQVAGRRFCSSYENEIEIPHTTWVIHRVSWNLKFPYLSLPTFWRKWNYQRLIYTFLATFDYQPSCISQWPESYKIVDDFFCLDNIIHVSGGWEGALVAWKACDRGRSSCRFSQVAGTVWGRQEETCLPFQSSKRIWTIPGCYTKVDFCAFFYL